jgi:anaerobic magnesium-protoporphyrin IX monomethyl ester cyclase
MRTLLINTPYPFSEMPQIPMGLAYVAAVLEKAGIEIQVQDFLIQDYSKEKLAQKIHDFSPELIGITSVTMNFPIASQILKDCKEIADSVITVIGGPHASFTVEETLRDSPWIDAVVIGEGERTMLALASGKEKPEEIDGLAYRENGAIKRTAPRKWIEVLDELPIPARHLFPISQYFPTNPKSGMITGRGCPFSCIFCVGHRMVGKKKRFRSPKLVVDEMEHILSLGFKGINIVDDLFTLNKKHVYTICDEINSRHLKFNWTCFARVDTVDAELLSLISDAGCNCICYGVETADQDMMNTLKKKITSREVQEAIDLTKKAGIEAMASFILGLPGETEETLLKTIKFAKDLEATCALHALAPFPGTELYENADKLGIKILTNDWSRFNANEAITETEGVPAAMVNKVLLGYSRGW